MNIMNLPDWIQSGALFVAVLALIWSARSLREQARSADFTSYLALTERYADAWRKFRDATSGPLKDFEFTEVLNLIEGTCHLYNKGTLHGATKEMIHAYLKEIIPGVFADAYAKTMVVNTFSGPDTYCYIRRFAERNGIRGVPKP